MLQDYFDVQTNVPVGDAPREADILLLQRTRDEPTPFRGLWRHLTTWNVFEFKGRPSPLGSVIWICSSKSASASTGGCMKKRNASVGGSCIRTTFHSGI